MNDTFITFRGWAGSEVRERSAGGVPVASVRVAATPRVRRDGEWVDGPTTWYDVTAWRTLADHLRKSVRKGDPLFVHGRLLRAETWAPADGKVSTTLEVEASIVGHDLNRGISHFFKERPERAAVPTETVVTGPGASTGDEAEVDLGGAGGGYGEERGTIAEEVDPYGSDAVPAADSVAA